MCRWEHTVGAARKRTTAQTRNAQPTEIMQLSGKNEFLLCLLQGVTSSLVVVLFQSFEELGNDRVEGTDSVMDWEEGFGNTL
jgi:hypothetical protein